MESKIEEVRKHFECPICLQIYNKKERIPRLLICGHSFCQSCLSKAAITSCPICKSKFPSFRLGQAYKNYSLLQLMELNSIVSEQELSLVIIKSTFNEIVDELCKAPKTLRNLTIKRTRDEETNPFENDLIRSNKKSMRFYKLIPTFIFLEKFEFWVKFSAHGFEQCLAESLIELLNLKKVTIVNQYDEYERMDEVISLINNQKIEFDIQIRKWT